MTVDSSSTDRTSQAWRPAVAGRNLEHARLHNRRTVLDAIRRLGPIPRAEIARRTSLTLQTILNIVEELQAEGLVSAGPVERGKRGQPYVPFTLNPRGAYTLGFNIARHAITGALVDLGGTPVAVEEVAQQPTTPAITEPIVRSLCEKLLARAGVSHRKVMGIGCALPVRFDLGGISTALPTGLPGWADNAERERFGSGLFAPTLIENDAVAAAIGEHLYGVARAIGNFVLLYLEEGLGVGLFLAGQPFTGAFGSAGEMGHLVIEPGGRPCGCGNRGCLERYVSLRAAYESFAADPNRQTPTRLNELFSRDPTVIDEWLKGLHGPLSRAIHILEMAFDPETIILSGPASADIMARVITSADPLPQSISARNKRSLPRLMLGSAGISAAALGAAALPVFRDMVPDISAYR